MTFHVFRPSFWPGKNLYQQLWSWHDRNPLSPRLNRVLRYVLYWGRRLQFALIRRQAPYRFGDDGSLPSVSSMKMLKSESSAPFPTASDVIARMRHVHAANRCLALRDGSWAARPGTIYHGKGISIEESALRIQGYMAAYRATGDEEYYALAYGAARYLLDRRVFADGHMWLQGHTVIDIPYAFAGAALIDVWRVAKEDEMIDSAMRIGDQLIAYQIAGSVNHAVTPAQLLCPLYEVTGEKRYLENAVKRVFRTAIPFQLPYGGWLGHESWIWYHAMITRSLIALYACMPTDLQYYAQKDRVGSAIIAALNRVTASQQEDGTLPIRPPRPICEHENDARHSRDTRRFCAQSGRFKSPAFVDGYQRANGYVVDMMAAACMTLGEYKMVPVAMRYVDSFRSSKLVSRLEFDTLAAGRAVELVRWYEAQPDVVREAISGSSLIRERNGQNGSVYARPIATAA